MWTMVTSIDYRGMKRRLARTVVASTVVLGTWTHVAMALYPPPEPATADTAAIDSHPRSTQLPVKADRI